MLFKNTWVETVEMADSDLRETTLMAEVEINGGIWRHGACLRGLVYNDAAALAQAERRIDSWFAEALDYAERVGDSAGAEREEPLKIEACEDSLGRAQTRLSYKVNAEYGPEDHSIVLFGASLDDPAAISMAKDKIIASLIEMLEMRFKDRMARGELRQ